MRAMYTMTKMSLRHQRKTKRHGEVGGLKDLINTIWLFLRSGKLYSHAHGKEAASLVTSAVIFEKVPTDRSTAAEKMTSSAHYWSLAASLSVRVHTLIATSKCSTRRYLTNRESAKNILNTSGLDLLTASTK